MYVSSVLTSCRRRWKVSLVCLAVVMGICALAARVLEPTYEATANVVLVPPKGEQDPALNRYMALGGLQESSDVLARSMLSEETARALSAEVPSARYEVATDLSTSAPVLSVSVTSQAGETSERMLAAVIVQLRANLRSLQQAVDVKPLNQVTALVVSRDKTPQVIQKTRIRLLGALVAGLLLASGIVVAAVDAVLLRRGEKRSDAGAASADEEAIPTGGGERERDEESPAEKRSPVAFSNSGTAGVHAPWWPDRSQGD